MFRPDDRATATNVVVTAMRSGEVVGVNADSSYALATDAFSAIGTNKIFDLKDRHDAITPILVGRASVLEGILLNVSDDMRTLIDAFWPGSLTIIAKPQPTLAWNASSDAISVRMPQDEWTREVVTEVGMVMAVAATRGDRPAPTTATQASELWGSDVRHWLNTGEADPEKLSTIVDFRGEKPNIVRLGALSRAEIRRVLPSVTMVAN
jgi:tRNA threonylcarbamoyl adenosine modification protein (Sua5/YciO/YrdC/YwlC family)